VGKQETRECLVCTLFPCIRMNVPSNVDNQTQHQCIDAAHYEWINRYARVGKAASRTHNYSGMPTPLYHLFLFVAVHLDLPLATRAT